MILKRISNSLEAWRERPGAATRGLVFIHLPKCGGNSIKNGIVSTLGPYNERRGAARAKKQALARMGRSAPPPMGGPDDFAYLEQLLAFRLAKRRKFVTGHYPVNAAFLDTHCARYDFVTVLREPMSRWISNYTYNWSVHSYDDRKHHSVLQNNPTYQQTDDLEARVDAVIGSDMSLLMGSLMTSFLTGQYPRDPDDALRLSKIAQQNLHRFAAVGLLDRLDGFAAALSDRLGQDLRFGIDNSTVSRIPDGMQAAHDAVKQHLGQPALRAKIAERCAADTALYDYAREHFGA